MCSIFFKGHFHTYLFTKLSLAIQVKLLYKYQLGCKILARPPCFNMSPILSSSNM